MDFEPEKPFMVLARAWSGTTEHLPLRELGGGYWRRLRDLDGTIPHVHTCPTCRTLFPCEKTDPTCEPFCRAYEQPDGTPHGTWIYCSEDCHPKVYGIQSTNYNLLIPTSIATCNLNLTWVVI